MCKNLCCILLEQGTLFLLLLLVLCVRGFVDLGVLGCGKLDPQSEDSPKWRDVNSADLETARAGSGRGCNLRRQLVARLIAWLLGMSPTSTSFPTPRNTILRASITGLVAAAAHECRPRSSAPLRRPKETWGEQKRLLINCSENSMDAEILT